MIFRIIYGEGIHTPQFDEQLRLIAASGFDAAYEKAVDIGQRDAYCFYHEKQPLVQWQFINVCELHCVTDAADGAEMFSCVREIDDAQYYIREVNQRAQRLLQIKPGNYISV